MNTIFRRKTLITSIALIFLGVSTVLANATHSWGGYHWARTADSFTLQLDDNVSGQWDNYLGTTSFDWSVSDVLNTTINPGQTNDRCRATAGKVEVCNNTYGKNGWLGIASIWISGAHIVQGTVKLNDTYFNKLPHNTPGWRNLVMCQEVGHTLGLDHQNEKSSNTNLGTCMDYTDDPTGTLKNQRSNEHPNQHDYNQLAAIYAHTTDNGTTVGATAVSRGNNADVNTDDPSGWGKEIRKDSRGNSSLFEKDLGNGQKLFTFVIWIK